MIPRGWPEVDVDHPRPVSSYILRIPILWVCANFGKNRRRFTLCSIFFVADVYSGRLRSTQENSGINKVANRMSFLSLRQCFSVPMFGVMTLQDPSHAGAPKGLLVLSFDAELRRSARDFPDRDFLERKGIGPSRIRHSIVGDPGFLRQCLVHGGDVRLDPADGVWVLIGEAPVPGAIPPGTGIVHATDRSQALADRTALGARRLVGGSGCNAAAPRT